MDESLVHRHGASVVIDQKGPLTHFVISNSQEQSNTTQSPAKIRFVITRQPAQPLDFRFNSNL